MIEWLQELGLFSAQVILIVVAIITVMGVFFSLLSKNKQGSDLEIHHINKDLKATEKQFRNHLLSKKELKEQAKKEKKEAKVKDKDKEKKPSKKRLFVIDFDGDIKASATDSLREEVTAILTIATPEDEVVARIESPGGVVHGYGLAASQLERIRKREIPLTACIDKVAASGGYMMASVAEKILSAPFAIVGSVGVVAQVPNIHKLLKKNHVDVEILTAGEYKRTLTMLGENTEEGRKKFVEQLEDTHKLFKNHISRLRPELDIQKISTGEYWYGQQALELKLVDQITTSDDYLMEKSREWEVYSIKYTPKKNLGDKISKILGQALSEAGQKLLSLISQKPLS